MPLARNDHVDPAAEIKAWLTAARVSLVVWDFSLIVPCFCTNKNITKEDVPARWQFDVADVKFFRAFVLQALHLNIQVGIATYTAVPSVVRAYMEAVFATTSEKLAFGHDNIVTPHDAPHGSSSSETAHTRMLQRLMEAGSPPLTDPSTVLVFTRSADAASRCRESGFKLATHESHAFSKLDLHAMAEEGKAPKAPSAEPRVLIATGDDADSGGGALGGRNSSSRFSAPPPPPRRSLSNNVVTPPPPPARYDAPVPKEAASAAAPGPPPTPPPRRSFGESSSAVAKAPAAATATASNESAAAPVGLVQQAVAAVKVAEESKMIATATAAAAAEAVMAAEAAGLSGEALATARIRLNHCLFQHTEGVGAMLELCVERLEKLAGMEQVEEPPSLAPASSSVKDRIKRLESGGAADFVPAGEGEVLDAMLDAQGRRKSCAQQ